MQQQAKQLSQIWFLEISLGSYMICSSQIMILSPHMICSFHSCAQKIEKNGLMNFVICALLLLSCLKSNFERLRQAPQEQQWKTKLGTSEAGRQCDCQGTFSAQEEHLCILIDVCFEHGCCCGLQLTASLLHLATDTVSAPSQLSKGFKRSSILYTKVLYTLQLVQRIRYFSKFNVNTSPLHCLQVVQENHHNCKISQHFFRILNFDCTQQ